MMTLRCALIGLVVAGTASAQSTNVAPNLLVFAAYSGHGNPAPQSVSITSAAPYQVTSQQSAWLTVTPRTGTAPSNVTVTANASSLRPGKYSDRITVSSGAREDTIPVVLIVTQSPPGGQLAIYEVEVSMKGYVGLLNGAPDCAVRTNGYDRLVGTVSGFETSGNDDDVVYTGTLSRDTDIDYCETKKAPTVDQRKWCAISLRGAEAVAVEITVGWDSLSGAWMKSQPAGALTRRITKTDCDAQETSDALNGYSAASDGGAASPNGQQLDDVKAVGPNGQPQSFSVGGVTRLKVGTYPPDAPDGWTLRVIRKLL